MISDIYTCFKNILHLAIETKGISNHVFIMYANLFVLEIELYCLSSIAFYFLKFYLYSSKEEIYLYFIIFFIVYGIYSEKYSDSLISWCKRDCR